MDFKDIQMLTANDMAIVNQIIQKQLNSDVTLIKQLGYYTLTGGKRLRPMLTILSSKALGYKGESHTISAAFIEFIHTATLLHDDVIDKSNMRRGKETANFRFGNAASILVGDFIYTRAFQMMTELGSWKIIKLMSNVVNIIAEGEVQQLMNCNNPNITEENYMKVIYSKTARLFEAATQIGAILNNAPHSIEIALKKYGKYLGAAFQLIDDVIDYTSSNIDMGKNTGDDLSEGKPTLPLLHAMKNSTPEQAYIIRQAIEKANGIKKLNEILVTMKKTRSLEYTRKKAHKEANKAIAELSILPESMHKEALIQLAHISVNRKK
ncbi:octaprenyl-diphosphate synthase [Candidatus Photodesmus katoptron]|uniref:octaprenyl diphosphate synthase n=1 Tax=Candidatus Photodesmus anomalopis TaxID=28176 RepID=UPI0004DA904E|nr:octaprenyl diphosphate synthase [Candidatus Photodesmus katoptron]KEY90078.1 octaprenyl-diphosphate synthase [Candidatus Photodesmus katoptron]